MKAPNNDSILLSVLIPVYNWDISDLIARLVAELKERMIKNVEIIIIDDSSSNNTIKTANQNKISEYRKQAFPIRYQELSNNLGRAAVRNLLVEHSQGAYLLFLDSDVVPDNSDFLSKYIDCYDDYDVICGGISYRSKILDGRKYRFYLYFSSKTDVKPSLLRNLNPWKHVLTSNILVRREVFENCPFDKCFTGYGYEDVEWGIRLSKNGYRIFHVENTVSHLGLVSKRDLLVRMAGSIENYVMLARKHPDFFQAVPIAHHLSKLKRLPVSVLQATGSILKLLFFVSMVNFFSYLLFQFYKTILLSLYFKRTQAVR
jgi:glycosyltransferase involved in cell wall biosynthesis